MIQGERNGRGMAKRNPFPFGVMELDELRTHLTAFYRSFFFFHLLCFFSHRQSTGGQLDASDPGEII